MHPHGGLLALLEPLPVLLQGADGVPGLAVGAAQGAIRKLPLGLHL